jgi:hypothetical protein
LEVSGVLEILLIIQSSGVRIYSLKNSLKIV